MRILEINSVYGYGSTGRNTEELVTFLTKKEHECFVAYAHLTCNYPLNFKYGSWAEKKWHAVYFRLFGQQGLCSTKGTLQLIQYIRKINPDIIHLNSIHGNHLNFPLFFKFLSENKYPVAWTLHDCWSFTGFCYHYTSLKCYKWKTKCGAGCPEYHAWLPEWGKDRVEEMYELKKKYFTSVKKLEIITVSRWLKKEVEQSFLSVYPVQYIYNWIDGNKFNPVYENIRDKYGIPENKKIVLSVGAKLNKESTKFRDAMALSKLLPDDMCLVMVGSLSKGSEFPSGIIHIPYIDGTDELAKIYSSAMVYVHFSMEDTFGKVIAEAMACGTPVIVYDSTACPELVGEGCGYFADPHNINEVFKYICTIQKNGRAYYTDNCLRKVRESFSADICMNEYLRIYQRLSE